MSGAGYTRTRHETNIDVFTISERSGTTTETFEPACNAKNKHTKLVPIKYKKSKIIKQKLLIGILGRCFQ
ncbi:hypothetical protein PMJ10TS2_10210 [Paenibacillus melissococcoides]